MTRGLGEVTSNLVPRFERLVDARTGEFDLSFDSGRHYSMSGRVLCYRFSERQTCALYGSRQLPDSTRVVPSD